MRIYNVYEADVATFVEISGLIMEGCLGTSIPTFIARDSPILFCDIIQKPYTVAHYYTKTSARPLGRN